MSAGRCFQIETLGAVDGPGLRLVLFLQGCPLRCPYCHNPESWQKVGGREITVDEVLQILRRYRRYYRHGGLTVSGGEPLWQAGFVGELFARCRREGFHTALDTAGCVVGSEAEAAQEMADLVLLDIKCADPVIHRQRFGFELAAATVVLQRRQRLAKPVWVRQVIAPGITDSGRQVRLLGELLARYPCVEKIELLPMRAMCLEKYRERGIRFPMEGDAPPDEDSMQRLRAVLQDSRHIAKML